MREAQNLVHCPKTVKMRSTQSALILFSSSSRIIQCLSLWYTPLLLFPFIPMEIPIIFCLWLVEFLVCSALPITCMTSGCADLKAPSFWIFSDHSFTMGEVYTSYYRLNVWYARVLLVLFVLVGWFGSVLLLALLWRVQNAYSFPSFFLPQLSLLLLVCSIFQAQTSIYIISSVLPLSLHDPCPITLYQQ